MATFKVGDKVRALSSDHHCFQNGTLGTIVGVRADHEDPWYDVKDEHGNFQFLVSEELELAD